MNIKISIIIPIYNASKFLDQCLESIVNNGYAGKEIEVLAIDDCSSDNSKRIVTNYMKKDSRIRLISISKNRGSGYARNLGIDYSNGKYNFFIDADDWIEKGTIDSLIKKINTQYDFVLFGLNEFNLRGKNLKIIKNVPAISEKNLDFFSSALLTVDGFKPMVWCYLFNKELIEKKSIRFPEGVYCQDIVFSAKCLFYSKKIGVVKKVFYNYRIHHESVTGRYSKKNIEDSFYCHNLIREFLIEKKVFEKYQNEFIIRILTCCIRPNFLSYFKMKKKDKELKKRMKSQRKHPIMSNDSLSVLENAYKYCYSIGNKSLGSFFKTTYLFLFLVKNAYLFTSFIMRIKYAISNNK